MGRTVKHVLVIAALAAGIAGCASKSESIAPAYVSPMQYSGYDCRDLSIEASRLSSQAAQAMGQQDSRASRDAVATGVALVLFWPAAFFISGDGASSYEVARLKGEMNALQQASHQQRCGIDFRPSGQPHWMR